MSSGTMPAVAGASLRRWWLHAACTALVIVAACSGGGSSDTTTTSSTSAAPTSVATTTTTTAAPVRLVGAMPDGLRTAVEDLYIALHDGTQPRFAVRGLAAALPGVAPEVPQTIRAEAATATLPSGDEVAAIDASGDLLVAWRPPGEDWTIAGAALTSAGLDPWFGDPPRLVVVLGSDARVGEDQQRLRADSVHLLGLDPATRAGSFVGLPRDAWVESPAGTMKLTNVMAGRGPEPVVETLTDLTGLAFEGHLVTGFEGFEGLIEALGGLEIDLPRPVPSGNNWDDYPAGPQTLDAKLALRLARVRKALPRGDFDRSFNQGLIAQAAHAQIVVRPFTDLPQLLVTLIEHTFTDLPTDRLVTLAALPWVIAPDDVVNLVVPGTLATRGGQSVVVLGDEAAEIFSDLADGLVTASG